MNAVMKYANVPAAELRAARLPEHIIGFVEANRAHLQRNLQQQTMFRDVTKGSVPGQADPAPQPPHMTNQQGQPSMPGNRPNQIPGAHPSGLGAPAGSQHNPQPNEGGPTRPVPPSPEQTRLASEYVQKMKQEFLSKNLPTATSHMVNDVMKPKYFEALKQVYAAASEIESKLPMYFYVIRNDEMVKKMIAIVRTPFDCSYSMFADCSGLDMYYPRADQAPSVTQSKIHHSSRRASNLCGVDTTSERPVPGGHPSLYEPSAEP